jgi:hypothetical protein
MDIHDLAIGYLEESEIDFVGLWQIAQDSREELGACTTEEARKFSLDIAKDLYKKGLRPGDYYLGSRFDYWVDEGYQAMLDRIEREWIKAGGDPNLAEPICYFARRPK